MIRKILLLMIIAINITADDAGEAVTSIPHLQMGVGARASGMGGAFVGLADDATTTYWNPAGLSRISVYRTHIASMYSKMSFDRVYSYLSVYEKLENNYGGLGLSWYNFRIDNIEETDISGNVSGMQNYAVNTFALSYGNSIIDTLKAGISLKYYYLKYLSNDAKGIGIDFGALYKPFGPFFQVGLVVQDINFGICWNTERKDLVYPDVRLGFSYNILYEKLIILADLEDNFKARLKTHFGAEYWLNEYTGIRAGLNDLKLTAGLSFKITNYQIDYSCLLDNNDLGDIHRFSIQAYF